MMEDILKLFKKPDLKKPFLVAAWPGMGNVALTAVNYLKDKLGAVPLGELTSTDYFAPTGAIVSKQIILPPERPNNQFYYFSSPQCKKDILFFIGSVQPVPHREYEFAQELLRIAKMWGVTLVFTTAAAPSDMNYRDTPRVFAVPNDADLMKKLMEYKVHFMGEGNIAGLNGLLISAAKSMNLDGICLLGEIPFFTAQIEFPKAALKVLEVLTRLLGVKIDMLDLELYTGQKEKEIAPLADVLTKGPPESEKDAPDEEKIVPEPEKEVPRSVRVKIEKLFRDAETEGSYKIKMQLKEELDRWSLFDEYQDRFLDLFRKA
jgi:proteasome assembly chaperone (PAC2) family protein